MKSWEPWWNLLLAELIWLIFTKGWARLSSADASNSSNSVAATPSCTGIGTEASLSAWMMWREAASCTPLGSLMRSASTITWPTWVGNVLFFPHWIKSSLKGCSVYGYDTRAEPKSLATYKQKKMNLNRKLVLTEATLATTPRQLQFHSTTLLRELARHHHSESTITYLKVLWQDEFPSIGLQLANL